MANHMLTPETQEVLTNTVAALGSEGIRVWGFMCDEKFATVETFCNYEQWPATFHAFLSQRALESKAHKQSTITIAEA